MEGRWIVGYQLMKSSVDYSLRLDLSVSSCSIVVRYLNKYLSTIL